MKPEAVLDTREGDRYIGFLVEQEEWQDIHRHGSLDPELIKVGVIYLWRITDKMHDETIEGKIPHSSNRLVRSYFDQVWDHYEGPKIEPVREVQITPHTYADHPNYGRF